MYRPCTQPLLALPSTQSLLALSSVQAMHTATAGPLSCHLHHSCLQRGPQTDRQLSISHWGMKGRESGTGYGVTNTGGDKRKVDQQWLLTVTHTHTHSHTHIHTHTHTNSKHTCTHPHTHTHKVLWSLVTISLQPTPADTQKPNAQIMSWAAMSVSYTHLTLPTRSTV